MHQDDQLAAIFLYRQLLEAWNRRSVEEFASLFTEDGNTVGFDGSALDGRQAIAAELSGIFADHPTARYIAKLREVRRLGATVILLRAVVGMVPPGKTELEATLNALQSLVIIEQGGRLKIALLQNTPAAFHGRALLAEQLTEELREALRSGRLICGPED